MIRVLLEGRDAPLYHFTTVSNFISMMRDGGKIKGQKAGYNYADDNRGRISKSEVISLTRNKNFNFASIRLTLDQRSLSSRYKIVPYLELETDKMDKTRTGAMEEVLVAKEIDLLKYCTEIEIVSSKRDSSGKEVIETFSSGKLLHYVNTQVSNKSDITLASNPIECAMIITLLVGNTKIHAGKNLKSVLTPIPDYSEKYVKLQSTNRIPKKNVADPAVADNYLSAGKEFLDNLGYTILSEAPHLMAEYTDSLGTTWKVRVNDKRVAFIGNSPTEVSQSRSDFLESNGFDVYEDTITASEKHTESDVAEILRKFTNTISKSESIE